LAGEDQEAWRGSGQQYSATVAAIVGIGPKDELEGMWAAQLIARAEEIVVHSDPPSPHDHQDGSKCLPPSVLADYERDSG
jgi:hypothetical protein